MTRQTMRGFTLMELMIVVVVVGALATIALPSFREQAARGKRAECRSGALQTMQQEERYFTQYNTYVAAAAPPASVKVKNFSGDNPANSACTVTAAACTGKTLAQCVEIKATPTYNDPKKINYFLVNSEGVRGCQINGSWSTTDKLCW